jgi:hypothetical protein
MLKLQQNQALAVGNGNTLAIERFKRQWIRLHAGCFAGAIPTAKRGIWRFSLSKGEKSVSIYGYAPYRRITFKFMENRKGRFSRRVIAFFWLLFFAIVIGVIIYLEQIEILYILATLALVALLLIVAFADLEKVGRETIENASE